MSNGVSADDADTWLRAFQQAVAAQDFDAGRRLFAEDVRSYGTRVSVMSGLGILADQQWRPVWTGTRGFHFTDVDFKQPLGSAWVVAARWESNSSGGQRREGRCTLVLVGQPPRCVHSHFSMVPLDGGRLR